MAGAMHAPRLHPGGPRSTDGTLHRHSDYSVTLSDPLSTLSRVESVLRLSGYDRLSLRSSYSLVWEERVKRACLDLFGPRTQPEGSYLLRVEAIYTKPSPLRHAAAVVRLTDRLDNSEVIVTSGTHGLQFHRSAQGSGVSTVLDFRILSESAFEVRVGNSFTPEAFSRESRLLSDLGERGLIARICDRLSAENLGGSALRRMQVSQKDSCPGFSVLAQTSTGNSALFYFERWNDRLPIVTPTLIAEAAPVDLPSKFDQQGPLIVVNDDLRERDGMQLNALERMEVGMLRGLNTQIPFLGVLWCYHRYGVHCVGLVGDRSAISGTCLGFFRDRARAPYRASDLLRSDDLKVRTVAGLPPQLAGLKDATLRVQRILSDREVRIGVYSGAPDPSSVPDSQLILSASLVRYLAFQ